MKKFLHTSIKMDQNTPDSSQTSPRGWSEKVNIGTPPNKIGQQQVHLLQQDLHLSKFPFKRMQTRCNTETPSEETNQQYSNPFQQKASTEYSAKEKRKKRKKGKKEKKSRVKWTFRIIDDDTTESQRMEKSQKSSKKWTPKILEDSTIILCIINSLDIRSLSSLNCTCWELHKTLSSDLDHKYSKKPSEIATHQQNVCFYDRTYTYLIQYIYIILVE
jgi:hypothetical protein